MITKEQKQQLLDMIFDAQLKDIEIQYYKGIKAMAIFVQNISIFHISTTRKNLEYPLSSENPENSSG